MQTIVVLLAMLATFIPMSQASTQLLTIKAQDNSKLQLATAKMAKNSKKDKAIDAGLNWLMRHQHKDGSWSNNKYIEECKDPASPCKSRHEGFQEGGAKPGFSVGITGLAVLAFASHGYTHKSGEKKEYVECMSKAVQWLLKQQYKGEEEICKGLLCAFDHRLAGGSAGADYKKRHKIEDITHNETAGINTEWIYNHAIATKALLSVLQESKDKELLGEPTQQAVNWCLSSQHEFGWGYGYKCTHGGNTSVTGWMVHALYTASQCLAKDLIQLDKNKLSASFELAKNTISHCTQNSTGVTGYQSPGDDGAHLSLHQKPYPYSKSLRTMTAVGMICRLAAGESHKSESLKKGKKLLKSHLPTWKPQSGKKLSEINMYYWYYGSCAEAFLKGSDWNKWKRKLYFALLSNKKATKGQRSKENNCAHGSWDPIGEWGLIGGRTYATAICLMSLGVDPKDFKK